MHSDNTYYAELVAAVRCPVVLVSMQRTTVVADVLHVLETHPVVEVLVKMIHVRHWALLMTFQDVT